jgi:hypothetical protein
LFHILGCPEIQSLGYRKIKEIESDLQSFAAYRHDRLQTFGLCQNLLHPGFMLGSQGSPGVKQLALVKHCNLSLDLTFL